MSEIKILYVQPDIIWEDPQSNFPKYEKLIRNAAREPDLIILPEMFNTGFSMKAGEIAESMEGSSMSWLKKMAGEYDAALCGSLAIQDQGKYFNRFVFVHPDEGVQCYDKRHLFRVSGEEEAYHPGNQRVVIKYKAWRILPQVCYDLRFPVWTRNRDDYDLLLFVASWPEPRRDVWSSLLKARAIENVCYTVGVNRVGIDGRNIAYRGDSMILNFKGELVHELALNQESSAQCLIDIKELERFRKKFPVHLDRDDFKVLRV